MCYPSRPLPAHSPGPIVYCLFDLMYLNGYDLRRTPLVERKRVLASLLAGGRAGDVLRYSDHLAGQGQAARSRVVADFVTG